MLGGTAGAALLLAAGPLLGAPPSPSTPSAARAASSATDAAKTVTLITGDRVIARGKNLESLSIVRAPGREKVRFTTRRLSDASGRTRHLFVIPDDAVALLGRDRVDLRLFDVARRIEFQYDDAHRADLPIIVTYAANGPQTLAANPGLGAALVPSGSNHHVALEPTRVLGSLAGRHHLALDLREPRGGRHHRATRDVCGWRRSRWLHRQ